MKPQRVWLRRVKGWRIPPNTIKVDRTNKKWGNLFEAHTRTERKHGTQADCVELFVKMLDGDLSPLVDVEKQKAYRDRVMRGEVGELRGKNLGCWCKPGTPCHGDILLKLANGW
jgi:Domain of unknown function (DUF4326)